MHTFTLCDVHMTHIVGKWYRCAFCAKDLCADCEASDTHDDSTHAFLVFKSQVSMEALGCAILYTLYIPINVVMSTHRQLVGDSDGPAACTPILRGNIYYSQHN
jgi:hypothetical protein